MANNNFPPESLQQARALVSSRKLAMKPKSSRQLEELAKLRESSLFHELGKLTRELHETLNSFHLDARIAALTQKDIPDAKERLNYVITMTEQAANRTLDAVERACPCPRNCRNVPRVCTSRGSRRARRPTALSMVSAIRSMRSSTRSRTTPWYCSAIFPMR